MFGYDEGLEEVFMAYKKDYVKATLEEFQAAMKTQAYEQLSVLWHLCMNFSSSNRIKNLVLSMLKLRLNTSIKVGTFTYVFICIYIYN